MPPSAQPTLHRSRSTSAPAASKSRMPSLFSTIRASLYGTVLLFTVICLAMAAHFQSVLAASDLTRFVPFAIFVCAATLVIYIILLTFSFFFRERNPISTRIELACLGLTGIFWLALGVFLVTSEAQDADVECFSQLDGVTPVDDEVAAFHTDQYQAMYRVLNAFSLMNAVLILFACLALLLLALRRHRAGDEHMWHGPVTSCAWFNTYVNGKPGAAGATGRSRTTSSRTRPILPIATAEIGKPVYTEKPERQASRRDRSDRDREPSSRYPYSSNRTPPAPPPKPSHATNYNVNRDRYDRGGYSPRMDSNMPDVENGGMLNPYSNRPRANR